MDVGTRMRYLLMPQTLLRGIYCSSPCLREMPVAGTQIYGYMKRPLRVGNVLQRARDAMRALRKHAVHGRCQMGTTEEK